MTGYGRWMDRMAYVVACKMMPVNLSAMTAQCDFAIIPYTLVFDSME